MISFKNLIDNSAECELITPITIIVFMLIILSLINVLYHFIIWQPFSYEFGRFTIIVGLLVLLIGHINYKIEKDKQCLK